MNGSVQKLILVVKGSESGETLERWVFDVECKLKDVDRCTSRILPAFSPVKLTLLFMTHATHSAEAAAAISDKPAKEVTQEIQAIIRQITASVTFLPLLNEPACFDLLVYADKQATVPVTWEDSDPCFIANSEQVKLRSFDTKVMLCLGCLAGIVVGAGLFIPCNTAHFRFLLF